MKYCCDDFKRAIKNEAICIDDEGECWTCVEPRGEEIIFKFCPFCGKELKDKAG